MNHVHSDDGAVSEREDLDDVGGRRSAALKPDAIVQNDAVADLDEIDDLGHQVRMAGEVGRTVCAELRLAHHFGGPVVQSNLRVACKDRDIGVGVFVVHSLNHSLYEGGPG